MSAVATAIVGGTIVGGLITSQGAQNAASTQANASAQSQANVLAAGQQASGLDIGAINGANSYMQPYANLGNSATGTVNNLLTGQNSGQMVQAMQNMPGYQFQLQQGLEAAQNGFAARGLGSSGAAMKGAAQYAQGLANSNYQNFFNNNLSAAQIGANAATLQSQNAANMNLAAGNALMGSATNAASLGMAGASATAAGQAASANAIGNSVSNIGNTLGQVATLNNLGMYGTGGIL